MARAGIYKSEVVRARERLLATGRYPSIDAVRAELGNTGSKGTIHRYLKEIEEEQGGATGTKVSISEAVQELVGRLASQLHEEADGRMAEASTKHAAKVQQLGDSIRALQAEADSARSTLEQTQLALAKERQAHVETITEHRDALLDRTKLAQQVTDLLERLAREEQHRLSLEEKHEQARTSLEHFRQAAKEQREQEHRKHDQATQYLQAELRSANQALAVKQHEATHAYQENSRLLAELAHAQGGLHGAQEEVRTLKQQVGALAHSEKHAQELGQQLVRQQAANHELETSNAQLLSQAKVLSDEKQQLALELATARATIETQQAMVDAILNRFDPKNTAAPTTTEPATPR